MSIVDKETRYAKCIRCNHIMTWFAHQQLRFAMDCPDCGTKKQFGPEVYVQDFQGYTMAEVIQRKKADEAWQKFKQERG